MQEFNKCVISVCTIEWCVNIILYWFVFKWFPADLFIAFFCKAKWSLWDRLWHLNKSNDEGKSPRGVTCVCQMTKGDYRKFYWVCYHVKRLAATYVWSFIFGSNVCWSSNRRTALAILIIILQLKSGWLNISNSSSGQYSGFNWYDVFILIHSFLYIIVSLVIAD